MTRSVNAPLAAALLVAAAPAAAQVRNALDRQAGLPAGVAVPVAGVAAAEEPAGISATPAAAGFVGLPALQWFHEGEVTPGAVADGLWAATGLGPLGAGLSLEWIRPGDGGGARYRKRTFALTLGDRRSFSLGVGWNRVSSPDPALDAFTSWDAGLTIRPWRHLSVAAAMLGRDARLRGARVPLRYDLGLATRFLDDAVTLTADLLADDRARDDFFATHVAFGAAAELRAGLALSLQVQVPTRDQPGVSRDPSAVVAIAWNEPNAGLSGGATATPERTGWLAGARASVERYRAPPPSRRAPTLDLAREIEPDRIPLLDLGDPDPYGLLLRRLDALATDPGAPAVVLKIGRLPLGAGRVEELRGAIAAVAARKPVLAYVTGGGTKEYWLATAATAVAVPPGSALQVNGLATSALYLTEGLARAGIAFEVVVAGDYKSAPEPLVRTGPSPEAREVTDAILDDVFGRVVGDIAAARGLPEAKVRALVDEGLLGSEEAKAAGLVDEVIWPDEAEGWARRAVGRGVGLAGAYRPGRPRAAQRWGRRPVIEVIRIEGAIVGGRSRQRLAELAGAETISAQLRRAAADGEVKAIVLRVDSPGGDGLASELIWREVARARERKPVVASMGDAAASGGYLAAVAADVVVAEPSTLTGSIGVFALKPDLSGLLAKLALRREAWARGEAAQLTSPAKPWSERERRAVERQIAAFYGIFVERVAEGRRRPRAEIEEVARGRVWTGRQAVERGLVDRLGSLGDALEIARKRAGLAPGEAEVRRAAGAGATGTLPLAGALARAADGPLLRAAASVPELRALSLLSEMGPVVAMPVEWVVSGR